MCRPPPPVAAGIGTVEFAAPISWSIIAVFAVGAVYLLLRAPDPTLLLESNDQGYQMALGMALATGRLPCFDVLTQYGPFVAVASWFGFTLTGGAVGEMAMDAIGYAVAIALAYGILRRHSLRMLAILAAGALLALFPRFYKWYFWLLPLVGIVMAEWFRAQVAASHHSPVMLLAAWGWSVGVTWLFRYDLGLEGAFFGVLVILVARWSVDTARRQRWWYAAARDGIWFLLMSALLPALLLGLIAVARGSEQLKLFLLSVGDGAIDSVQAYGIRPFAFDLTALASAGNVLALLQLVFVVVYGLALCVVLRQLAPGQKFHQTRNGFGLFCIVLTGLGVLPQALHRADMQHLLQVVPPFLMTLVFLLSRFVGRFATCGRPMRVLGIAGFVMAAVLLGAAVPEASIDLASPWRDPVRYWTTIAHLPDSKRDEPVADMAMAIRRLTPPQASVFLIMATSKMPLLFFAQRHQPGLFPVYEAGMFSGHVWLAHNRRLLIEAPPDYVVVPEPGSGEDVGEPAPFMPDLTATWMRHYTRTLYANARYRLLAREIEPGANQHSGPG